MDPVQEAQPTDKGTQDQLWNGINLKTVSIEEFANTLTHASPEIKKQYTDGDQSIFAEMHKRWETGSTAPAQPGAPAPSSDAAAQPQPGQAPAGTGQPAATTAEPPEELIRVEIPKKLLGTYLTGRTDSEGIIEALKGKQEADRTLKQWGEDRTKLFNETKTLREQLLDATIKAKTATSAQPTAPAFPQIAIEDVDFSALEAADLMDPDNHGLIKDGLKKLKGVVASVKQAAEAAKTQTSPATPYKPDEDPEVVQQRSSIRNAEQARDLFELELTVAQTPALQMSVNPQLGRRKTFQEVDSEVSTFYDTVKQALGITGDRMQAVNFYFGDSPDSKVFRDSCVQRGIVPPPDYDRHQAAFRAYKKYTGSKGSIPIQDAVDLEIIRNTHLSQPAPASAPAAPPAAPAYPKVIEQHQRQAQANSTPPGYIPDIPPSVGSQSGSVLSSSQMDDIATRAFKAIENYSPDMSEITPDEARLCVEWFRAAGKEPHSKILARSKQ